MMGHAPTFYLLYTVLLSFPLHLYPSVLFVLCHILSAKPKEEDKEMGRIILFSLDVFLVT